MIADIDRGIAAEIGHVCASAVQFEEKDFFTPMIILETRQPVRHEELLR
jgi:hypothetical protein